MGEDVQAVAVGEPDVEEDGGEVGVTGQGERFGDRAGGGHGVLLFAKDGFERVADVSFVVDDEDGKHKGC